MTDVFVRVAVDQPMPVLFDYRYALPHEPAPGMLVLVPFGRREVVGLICEIASTSDVPASKLRSVSRICVDCPPLSMQWIALAGFAADYYQRGLGEVALPALPQALRDASRWERLLAVEPRFVLLPSGRAEMHNALPARATALRRLADALTAETSVGLSDARALHPKAAAILDEWLERGWIDRAAPETPPPQASPMGAAHLPQLTDEQREAVEAIAGAQGFAPFLLHGVTGSGKTEVYLHALAELLAARPDAQALVLVPEINLTPQFEAAFRSRFAALAEGSIVTMHSGLAEGERARNWLAAHTGSARIVLGTRLAILASAPQLAIIVVDEEHDPAYKQQEGLRYSARDLAVYRAKQLDIPVVLGSATPSLETWWQAEQGRYTRLTLTRRAVAEAVLPAVRLVDLEEEHRRGRASVDGLSGPLISALQSRLERGEQSLVFLNRRGYAPILSCEACGWVAGCPRCSAYAVLHKPERALRCHHCGWESRIPKSCPECGNVDIAPMGRGTQRVEETLASVVPGARVLRIDADSTRRKGSAQALFSDVHAGEVDILVGTQMIAKGHDFRRVTLVGVLNADTALFSHDFRASERLFAQLTQVSGRAGRAGLPGEVLIQTRYPRHALYLALSRQDYVGFANATLAERRDARLPPFVYQAMLRAEGRTLEAAIAFLEDAAAAFAPLPGADRVTVYDPVPLTIVKVFNVHRAQLLLESGSRGALQSALRAWQPILRTLKGVLRWNVEVDPLDV
ncbi:primosomal protein N' [Caballeronia grimmiae]|uniref:Replication restart protein PriA n=1 Tax=Caballeronia grimmiae TaxID=1071679 RepID=A0A069P5I8_9BURK|nr:primosomal protein N' [Caballeronia grimmiae]KDR35848.1 primosome assembly protein PriA [Caballeronia grimmiae]GGD86783.1 primosomal protein N' [Caballeronia grimmiae]